MVKTQNLLDNPYGVLHDSIRHKILLVTQFLENQIQFRSESVANFSHLEENRRFPEMYLVSEYLRIMKQNDIGMEERVMSVSFNMIKLPVKRSSIHGIPEANL